MAIMKMAASGSEKYVINNTTSKPSRRNFYILPCTIFLILLVGASTVGYFTYSRLSGSEQVNFKATYTAAVNDMESKVQQNFIKKRVASDLANSIYTAAIQNGYAGTLPNATLPGFDNIMGNVGTLSGLSAISFSPLVTNVTRHQWEEYATINADFVDRPFTYNLPPGGSWSVPKGIANCSTYPPLYNTGHIAGSPNSNWLFPFWQIVTKLLLPYESSLMFDPRSSPVVSTKEAIDHVILSKSCVLTDILTGYRVTVDDIPRPSSVIFSPIIGLGDAKPIVGLITSQFFWEDVFQPSMLGNVFCVVKTPTQTFTLHVDTKRVKFVGFSDQHDLRYSSFEHNIGIPEVKLMSKVPGLVYSITIYPANSFYAKYVTQIPRNACFLSVCFVVVPVFLFSVYVYLVTRHEEKLISERNASVTEAVSRGAVLKAKKVYVRYISHEMRTPLNAAHLGLKILEKSLNSYEGPRQVEHLELVREVGTACEMAVTILNDLLNYDKLEDETLIIEPSKVVASDYILQSITIFARQAQDKGVAILFDIDESFYQELAGKKFQREIRRGNINEYLHLDDRINVDVHKMNQVIRNVISNAIKFTPQGDSITIRARKKPPMLSEPVIEEPPAKKSWFLSPSFQFTETKYDDLEGNLDARDREDLTCYDQYGYLVLDIIDTGVGMLPEDSCRLFKEIIQFNPGELQVQYMLIHPTQIGVLYCIVSYRPCLYSSLYSQHLVAPNPQAGGGSGLGLMITKGIVDLHRGSISVFSGGIGKGCTVTIVLPLTSSSSQSIEPFVDPDVSNFVELPAPEAFLPADTAVNSYRYQPAIGLSGSHTARDSIVNEIEASVPVGEISWDEIPQMSKDATENDDSRCIEVLVVDDSKLSRRMLLRFLQSESYTCDEAEDGLMAVQKVLERGQGNSPENTKEKDLEDIPGNVLNMYDAILMDFMMPIMDGPTATRKIRDMGYEGLILGVTGNALPSDIDLFMGHGADRVLTKPVNVDFMKTALKGVRRRRGNRVYAN